MRNKIAKRQGAVLVVAAATVGLFVVILLKFIFVFNFCFCFVFLCITMTQKALQTAHLPDNIRVNVAVTVGRLGMVDTLEVAALADEYFADWCWYVNSNYFKVYYLFFIYF